MNLALLVYELKALGIKSLAIELSDSDQPSTDRERDTLAPGATTEPAEPKDPTLCVVPECGEKSGGIFNGIARHMCRAHAMQQAGVRT